MLESLCGAQTYEAGEVLNQDLSGGHIALFVGADDSLELTLRFDFGATRQPSSDRWQRGLELPTHVARIIFAKLSSITSSSP